MTGQISKRLESLVLSTLYEFKNSKIEFIKPDALFSAVSHRASYGMLPSSPLYIDNKTIYDIIPIVLKKYMVKTVNDADIGEAIDTKTFVYNFIEQSGSEFKMDILPIDNIIFNDGDVYKKTTDDSIKSTELAGLVNAIVAMLGATGLAMTRGDISTQLDLDETYNFLGISQRYMAYIIPLALKVGVNETGQLNYDENTKRYTANAAGGGGMAG